MANDGLKDIVSSAINRAVEDAFNQDVWSTVNLSAQVNLITPSETMVAVRTVNIIAGQSEVEKRFFRVKITEVK